MLFTVERFRGGLQNLLAESSNVVNYIKKENTGLTTRNYCGERNYFVIQIFSCKKDKKTALISEKNIFIQAI